MEFARLRGVEGADYQREVEEEDAAAVEENLQGERHGSAPKPTLDKYLILISFTGG